MLYLGIRAAVLGLLLVVQAVVLRKSHRNELSALQVRHTQYQREATGKFDTMKKQIAQLQSELAAARHLLHQADEAVAAAGRVDVQAARQAMERELAAGESALQSRHDDDFADTQVSMHDTDDSVVLLG
jgi:predicted  nucleic acid-binding Zn-ribbon protein